MIFELIIALVGYILTFLLFAKHRSLASSTRHSSSLKISVIIPARNEEKNLPLLLGDLQLQTIPIHEIICVDDSSTDGTATVAHAFSVRLITVDDKPDGWTGKSYACQLGADSAAGDVYLFLDADVRLKPNALSALIAAYEKGNTVLSVQPYHSAGRFYEQLSMFFNLIQIAATGLALPFKVKNGGLFGPVIMISRDDYRAVGGHATVKTSVTEDLALGNALQQQGIPFELRHGGGLISFRMYAHGFHSLLQGWSKNFATGALKTPLLLMLAVILWVTGCLSVPYHLVSLLFSPPSVYLWIYCALYLLWLPALWHITRPIGSFSVLSILFYPIALLVFIGVFAVSLFKKLFGLNVTWKNRKISLR